MPASVEEESVEDGYGADGDIENSVARLLEVNSDAGYSDCSEVLREDLPCCDLTVDSFVGLGSSGLEISEPVVNPPVVEPTMIEESPVKQPSAAPKTHSGVEVKPHKKLRGKAPPEFAALSPVEFSWRKDMNRWSKFLKIPMEDERAERGKQQFPLNVVCPFLGNWSEGFEALAEESIAGTSQNESPQHVLIL